MAMLSSPLAAMAPPPCPANWAFGRNDEKRKRALGARSFGRSTTFTFGSELSGLNARGKPATLSGAVTSDYFAPKAAPMRGSSPAASLAADLSQNFFIEQSPQLPTPRRSLFTSGIFSKMSRPAEGVTTPPIVTLESASTPVPSSSPCGVPDSMDYSPLPHKPAFALAQKQQRFSALQSPSRKSHNDNEDMSSTVPQTLDSAGEFKLPSFERRRSNGLRRPSLVRQRCQSTSFLSKTGHDLLPPFTFGAGGNGALGSSTASQLEQSFAASPQPMRSVSSVVTMPAPPPARPRLGSINSAFQLKTSGSPSQVGSRKSCAPAGRPRKLFRRTLSMYEHPADVMNAAAEKPDRALESIMDVDDPYHLKLPNFVPEDKPDSLPRINQETMISVLEGQFDANFERRMVIDCRFEYEFNGGHIDGAVNFNDKEQLARSLFEPATLSATGSTLIILHCEYSAHRAPLMAKYLRQQDRSFNTACYPHLTYPEVYILDGGYSTFFKNHRLRCYPQSYVEMESQGNERECEIGLNKIRIGQRGKLGRAQTYAFGQKLLFKKDSQSQSQSQPDRTTIGGFGVIEEHSSPCRPGAGAACASIDMLGAPLSTQPTITSDWDLELDSTATGKMAMTKRTVSY